MSQATITTEYQDLCRCVEGFNRELPRIAETATLLVDRFKQGKTLYACGNGGSATDAMHLCEELIGRYRGDRSPLPAVCVNADTSALTCIGNDYGFETIFSRQIKALGKPGDLLVGFSTSGNSENVRQAFTTASQNGLTTILLTGKTGGKIKTIADYVISVPSANTARIQELHTFILHAWLEHIENQAWL
ncbi:MAG: SIS domain-containing protein [Opitutales bacterium]|nr:SIS domain-containing protein [Opitutales bacterium]MCH8475213.1 SIS domain-containing protein [Opitutales bacterium]